MKQITGTEKLVIVDAELVHVLALGKQHGKSCLPFTSPGIEAGSESNRFSFLVKDNTGFVYYVYIYNITGNTGGIENSESAGKHSLDTALAACQVFNPYPLCFNRLGHSLFCGNNKDSSGYTQSAFGFICNNGAVLQMAALCLFNIF